MKGLKPPYFVELHASCGHAVLPERRPTLDAALQLAQTFQMQAIDDAYFCISNRDQEVAWPPQPVWSSLLPCASGGEGRMAQQWLLFSGRGTSGLFYS